MPTVSRIAIFCPDVNSAKKTSRVIMLDEGHGRSVTSELAAVIADGAFYDLDAAVKRMGALHVPIPSLHR
jgi:acetoin:2,6-dichlorophenolindophenol oxidoreductase subunit beta